MQKKNRRKGDAKKSSGKKKETPRRPYSPPVLKTQPPLEEITLVSSGGVAGASFVLTGS